jgi:3-oxoacyl-[acyl-carrier protein] reductase
MKSERDSSNPAAKPSGTGCVECSAEGGWWLHLRRCVECGYIGCCDTPPNQHASKGASGGIGTGVARLLATRGMRIVVNYRSSRDRADDVVASIRSAGGEAMAVQADVRDRSDVLGMVEQVRAAMGEVEVLVHSALTPYAIKSFGEISWDELGSKLEQEMRAAFLITKAVVPGMISRGYGRIIYLGAVLSQRPQEGMIALGTSKAALSSFALYVAEALGPRGITVNVVAPGR